MQLWEHCEVAFTPKQLIVRIYSNWDTGIFESVQPTQEWGALLTRLGAEGWEMVSALQTKANHALYYFKRPFDSSEKEEWLKRKAALRESSKKLYEQFVEQQQSANGDNSKEQA